MLKKKCFLPRTLKIKFGEEYIRKCSKKKCFYLAHTKIKFGGEYSSVYYSTIRGLNAHSMYTYLTMCVEYTENLTK